MNGSGIVKIHGKEYQLVSYRVNEFRKNYKNWTIETEILHRDKEEVVVKATIKDDQNRVIATGHSEEKRASSMINKTSALENAETSCIGRALAAFGMGGTEFASAEEVANAILQQKGTKEEEIKPASEAQVNYIRDLLRKKATIITKYLTEKQKDINDLFFSEASELINICKGDK